jgi:uncharacterized membrane protein YjgN (DUF898 family)
MEDTARLNYDAQLTAILKIWVINLLMNIVTLGIYSFWGKTKLRKYIIGSLSFLGDRFEYIGTGKELFKGFLKFLLILLPIYCLASGVELYVLTTLGDDILKSPALVLAYSIAIKFLYLLGTLVLLHIGSYFSWRYRISRITWRGIRGRLTGSAVHFTLLVLWRTILNFLTLGVVIPYSDIKIRQYIWQNTYLGSSKVKFDCQPSKLMWNHITTMLLFIPTLGLSRFWYRATLARHINGSISLNNITLQGTQTGGSMLRLFSGNLLIMILTLGLGGALVAHRQMKYLADNTIIAGKLDTSSISQSIEQLGKSGEGIETMLGEHDFGLSM